MKTFAGVFAVAAIFAAIAALVYWFSSRGEVTGTALLGIMTLALLLPVCYAVVAERGAALSGDDPSALPGVEETLGIVTTNTPYPIVVAVAAAGLLAGILWAPLLAAASLVTIVLVLWRLGAESARS